MRHPKRFLQDFADEELEPRKRAAVAEHLLRCSHCARLIDEHRRLRVLLARTDAPELPVDLSGRIFDRTSSSSSGSSAAGASATELPRGARRTVPSARRTPLVAVGGLAAASAAILAGAYVVGVEGGGVPVAGADAASALRTGWESVAPETPAVLGAVQLDRLRENGWYCPELEAMGFALRSAEGRTVGGRPTLELVLSNGTDLITVYEQRRMDSAGDPDTPPVNAVTGNPVTVDGFEHIGGTERDMWVHPGEPWQVVLDSPSVTYTVVSTMAAAAMPQTLNQLVATEHAQLAPPPHGPDNSTMTRILRGLSVLADPGQAQ
ncbi:hypothetical protein IWX75_000973 [Arthrobacter sp. CAN_A6]|uniref:anti-sigma factor family protein n=1 Tax=Arthrobacter sp. CAN_A6 TaxID=2787721 RepID=UPI0018CB7E2E